MTRAANGFALVALTLLVLFTVYGQKLIFYFFPALATHPADNWPGLIFAVPIAIGLARFLYGVRKCRGYRNGLLAGRALVKLAVGGARAWYLWGIQYGPLFKDSFWAALGCAFLLCLAWRWLLTGAARFVLLTMVRRSSAEARVRENLKEILNLWVAAESVPLA